MHLICHVNIGATVNLSSDNNEKKLISADLWNSPQILISAENPMWERACDICQSHKGYSLSVLSEEKGKN